MFAFGSAGFFGSLGGIELVEPIVGMAAAPDGEGYWLVASDGGVFAFGSAGFFGSLGGIDLVAPIVAMVPSVSGAGYLLAAADGGVFAFGDVDFQGSAVGGDTAVVAMDRFGDGYALIRRDGDVIGFGVTIAQEPIESTGDLWPQSPAIGIAARADGGYWVAHGDALVLEEGERRQAVEALEARLFELGYYPGVIDSVFDERTEDAIRAFQSVEGLALVDGVAGPDTLRALERATRPAPPVAGDDLVVVSEPLGVVWAIEDGVTQLVFDAAVGGDATPTPIGERTVLVQLLGEMESQRWGRLLDPAFLSADGFPIAARETLPASTSGAVIVSPEAQRLLVGLQLLDPGDTVMIIDG